MSAPATAYDEIAYPTPVFPQTHPNRLGTIATLRGMNPARPERCRMLEVGCGEAVNLIALALNSPDSRFIGFDLSASAIERGQAVIRELGLTNIELTQVDLMEYRPSEPFDYIIAHGFFSWVPDFVQQRLLELCRAALAPQGIAYISYNTYPGFHIRRMLRDMMRFHAGPSAEPRQKLERARGLLRFLLAGYGKTDEFSAMMQKEAEWILNRDGDAILFHDDLADINTPFWFHEFAGLAAQHGLQFLAEADFFEMQIDQFAPEIAAALHKVDDQLILREQYVDFLKCRRFRQSLLVHAEVEVDREPNPERVRDLFVASAAKPELESVDLSPEVIQTFIGVRGAAMRIDHPLSKAAMLVLHSTWPRPIPFSELASGARQLLKEEAASENDVAALAEVLFSAFSAGLVELHCFRPKWATEVSERPIASPLVRLQLRSGQDQVASLRPINVLVEVPLYQRLFTLLDGTRTRADLVKELAPAVERGELALPEGSVADLASVIDSALAKAAAEAMLIG